jgi:mannose-6-phosphate isomerase
LLIKLIDAALDLSVQVHPDDDYARIHVNDRGKYESWIILDAHPTARLQWGHHATTRQQLNDWIDQGQWQHLLNYRPVHAGEVYYIPAGTVHAICEGTFLLEVQQSSDVTYRLYDYNRRDAKGQYRALHLEDAKAVIHVPAKAEPVRNIDMHPMQTRITTVLETPYFMIEQWTCKDTLHIVNQRSTYYLIYVLDGHGTINGWTVNAHTTLLVTSDTDTLDICGNVSLIVSSPRS